MQQEPLEYRNPSTRKAQRPAWPVVLASLAGCLFVASVIWCVATWNSPGRLIFVPAGDAAMGFRSDNGWLTWIEYTEWDKREYPSWRLPWPAPLVVELLLVWLLLRRARKRVE
jgi:hypothetical protein